MKVKVNWRQNTAFCATTETGHKVWMDGPPEKGGQNFGARPMEMLLVGIGGCSSYDVVSTLEKSRQAIVDCQCDVTAERADAIPAVFTQIHLHFTVVGKGLESKKVERAVQLSAEKYCSASIMMQSAGAKVTHSFECVPFDGNDNDSSSGPPAGMQGLHHLALFAKDLEAAVSFYRDIIGMEVEWQPDADNYYLTSGADNLALHRAGEMPAQPQSLDHIGFVLETVPAVHEWYAYLKGKGVTLKNEPKTHRDGATSFYALDPVGHLVQFIHHPPISCG